MREEKQQIISDVTNDDTWVKLYRSLYKTNEWSKLDSVERDIFINILLNANFRDYVCEHKSGPVSIKAGQMMTTYQHLSEMCGTKNSKDFVRRTLNKLKDFDLIDVETFPNKFTIITVKRWQELYAASESKRMPGKNDSIKQHKQTIPPANSGSRKIYCLADFATGIRTANIPRRYSEDN